MQWTQKKKYLIVAIVALLLGAAVYGGKQYIAAKELARINAMRIEGGFYSEPIDYNDYWYIVPPLEIYDSGIHEGDIPALSNPATMTIAEADKVIADDLGGISVEVNGEHRFYPVQIMNWHEVVHDTLGGERILVYYGPLTGAAAVYTLPENMSFTVSGKEYNNDVLLHEEGTSAYWSGILGTPVMSTNIADASRSLERISSTFMTWGEWKDSYSSGTVLSADTGYTRDYTRHPYGNYENSPGVYFPVNHSAIPVRAKEPAYLVQFGKESALVLGTVSLLDQTPSVEVSGECVVALRSASATYANIFSCMVDGRNLSFTRKDSATFTDAETGSIWSAIDGRALEGELAGKELTPLSAVRLYTFAADALFPGAAMIGSEFVFEEEKAIDPTAVDAAGGAMIEGENTDGATIEILPIE